MSQQIVLAGSTKRLALSSGQAIRSPIYGHNFTKMRIGLRLCFPNAAVTVSGTPQLVFGLCNGNANGYADPTTTNFVGLRSTATVWTLGGTPGTNGYFGSLAWKACTRVGSTLTDQAGTIGGSTLNYVSAEPLIRCAMILQIEKGSPNYTLRLVMPISSGAAQADVSDAQFVQFMEMDDVFTSPGSIIGNYQQLATNNTIAADEANGQFDSICIFWDKISVPVHLDDVAHRLIQP
jgi:hypothetical protein